MASPASPLQPPADRERGQSFAEFAIVLPVLLLIVLVAIDFGRVYLGYINLQQMARVAANYAAEHARAWDTPINATILARYQDFVANDAATINCNLPVDLSGNVVVPDPMFPDSADGFDLGDRVQVRLDCSFDIITPVISQILGTSVTLSASTTYPIKEGVVATVPGGGGPVYPPPEADFLGSPRTGYAPLEVVLTDRTTNSPTSWTWSFGNGTASGPQAQGPHTRTYDCAGNPGDTCEYTVWLEARNLGGFDRETRVAYIVVEVPPATGPVAEFEATSARIGFAPLTVSFAFVDVQGGTVTYTDYEWDFTGDGTTDRTGRTTSWSFSSPGLYSVTLTVTEAGGAQDAQTKTAYVWVNRRICTVPDFAGVRVGSAQALWSSAGFSTTVSVTRPPSGNYIVNTQSLVGGTIDPQPDGCDSAITVGP